ncbi:MAG: heavy metal-associated domain-containing protein [Pseudomonadota bacterium]|nr:heavy metal-associated domain-containing protein [Pseudomonadota bacterium]
MSVAVENIKCGGCANGIKQKLTPLEGVQNTEVDIVAGLVTCELDDQLNSEEMLGLVKTKLASMGYPEVGSVEGLKAAGAKAKSYVSCAVGKMSDSSTSKDK